MKHPFPRGLTGLLLLGCAVSLGAAPIAGAEEKALTPQMKTLLQAVMSLDTAKQKVLFDRVGIAPSKDFYNCLCSPMWFAPSQYGPCEGRTVAYGTEIHGPFTADARGWASCAASHLGADGSNVLESLLAKTTARPGSNKDYAALLSECRSQYLVQQSGARARELSDGYDYLAQNGVPVLPPPESIGEKMKRDARLEMADLNKALGDAKKAADENAATSMAKAVGDKIFETATSKDTYLAAAETAMAVLELDMLDNRNALSTAQQEHTKYLNLWNKDPTYAPQLNAAAAKVNALKAAKEKLEGNQATLKTLTNGIHDISNAAALDGIYKKAFSGDTRQQSEAMLETTKMIQHYVDKYKDQNVDLSKALASLAKKKGMTEGEYKAFLAQATKTEMLEGASQVLEKTVKAGEWGLQAYDAYAEYNKQMAAADQLAQSGRYDEAQATLLSAFNMMGAITEKAAGFMPSGAKELAQFYAEALKMPGTIDAKMRKYMERTDDLADIEVSELSSKAMKRFNQGHSNETLRYDPYLHRVAGLTGYQMLQNNGADYAGDKPFVLMPEAGGAPIYVSRDDFDRIKELAYYTPIAEGRRMTDADVKKALAGLASGKSINVDDMRKKAEATLKDAAVKKRIADMFGQKSVSFDDISLWYTFNDLMNQNLPSSCKLSLKSQKALFSSFREPGGHDTAASYLAQYGTGLKLAEQNLPAR